MIILIMEGPLTRGEDRGYPSELRRVGAQASLLEVGEKFQMICVQKCLGCGNMFWIIVEKGLINVWLEKERVFFPNREKCNLNW